MRRKDREKSHVTIRQRLSVQDVSHRQLYVFTIHYIIIIYNKSPFICSNLNFFENFFDEVFCFHVLGVYYFVVLYIRYIASTLFIKYK